MCKGHSKEMITFGVVSKIMKRCKWNTCMHAGIGAFKESSLCFSILNLSFIFLDALHIKSVNHTCKWKGEEWIKEKLDSQDQEETL